MNKPGVVENILISSTSCGGSTLFLICICATKRVVCTFFKLVSAFLQLRRGIISWLNW